MSKKAPDERALRAARRGEQKEREEKKVPEPFIYVPPFAAVTKRMLNMAASMQTNPSRKRKAPVEQKEERKAPEQDFELVGGPPNPLRRKRKAPEQIRRLQAPEQEDGGPANQIAVVERKEREQKAPERIMLPDLNLVVNPDSVFMDMNKADWYARFRTALRNGTGVRGDINDPNHINNWPLIDEFYDTIFKAVDDAYKFFSARVGFNLPRAIMFRGLQLERQFSEEDDGEYFGILTNVNDTFDIVNQDLDDVRLLGLRGKTQFLGKIRNIPNFQPPREVVISLMFKWYTKYFYDDHPEIGGLIDDYITSLDRQPQQDDEEQDNVAEGMEDADINGVIPDRAVNMRFGNHPGGPNNPAEDGIPHYTRFLYNTDDDFDDREILLDPDETKGDNARFRRLAGELLAYARWGKAQRRDVGDLVVRGNNALLANRIITGDVYDASNARIHKSNVFGSPNQYRPYARETYDEYKDKNPLIVGQNIGKKIRKYVIQASRIWPTHAQPAQPFDYVDIFNPV